MAAKNGKKNRYSDKELKEFEKLILTKLENAKNELNLLKDSLSRNSESGTEATAGTMKVMEDGADTIEKENLSQLAARQQKPFAGETPCSFNATTLAAWLTPLT